MKTNYTPLLQYDASDAALISGSAQLASSAINAMSVSGSSKKDREFMKEMHDKQRAEALADRDYANQYNLPSNEMARLKAAGLNPNLIYGKAGGDMASAPVRSADYTQYHRQAPQVDLGSAVGSYFQIQSQQSQLQNMAAQRALLDAQAQKEKAQAGYYEKLTPQAEAKTQNIIADTDLKKVKYNVESATQDIDIALKSQRLDQLYQSTKFTFQENIRQAITLDKDLYIASVHAAQMLEQTALTVEDKKKAIAMTELIKQQTQLKKYDNEYIKNTGNTGRPNESPIAKLVEIIYGKLSGMGKNNSDPKQNLPPNIGGYIIPDPNQ